MLDKRIGAQLFTLRDYCKTIEDFETTCKKLDEIGYKMLQISAVGPTDGAQLKAAADKYNLETTVTHCSADKYVNDLNGIIKYHNDLGCKIAGLGCMPDIANFSEEKLYDFIKTYNVISKTLKDNGITFAYHNHSVEFRKIKGKYVIDILLENTDADSFKLIFDTYWASYAGVNPADFIKNHKGRIICTHFKDLAVTNVKDIIMAPVGEGNLDWDKIIDACNESEIKYAYVEQDNCNGEDPFDCMKRSYEFLTKKGFC